MFASKYGAFVSTKDLDLMCTEDQTKVIRDFFFFLDSLKFKNEVHM